MLKNTIWLNGKYLAGPEGKVSLASASLHYGTGVFEGILCVKSIPGGKSAVFRLREHIGRLFGSARVLGYRVPYSAEELTGAITGLVKANKYGSCYIRPFVFGASDYLGLLPESRSVNTAVLCRSFNPVLYRMRMGAGLKVTVSKTIRNSYPDVLIKAKASGKYLNGVLAKSEAAKKGFDDALLLDRKGNVSEATSSNIFIVKGWDISTPSSKGVLSGITRDSVIRISGELGFKVSEKEISPEELFGADEVFLTGTALGIVRVCRADARKYPDLGSRSPVKRLRRRYLDILEGKAPEYREWLTCV